MIRSLKVRGRRWKYQEVAPSRCVVKGKKVRGYCDENKMQIAVSTDLNGVLKLDTIIHEFLHAALPDLNDDDPGPVYTTAHDLARFLTRLGYTLDKR